MVTPNKQTSNKAIFVFFALKSENSQIGLTGVLPKALKWPSFFPKNIFLEFLSEKAKTAEKG